MQAAASAPQVAAGEMRRLTLDRLFVIWRDPVQGSRYVIGELWRDKSGYAFAYKSDLPQVDAFAMLPEFPEHRVLSSPYRAKYLFPTFAQRVPSPARVDVRDLFKSWGVERPDDAIEVLARSGGVQTTDRLELAEYRANDDRLEQALEMRIAGASYHDAPDLSEGDCLELRREPDNRHDPYATVFLFKDGTRIGYVPRQYAALISSLLDSGVHLGARAVRRLVLPLEGGRWVVRVSRR